MPFDFRQQDVNCSLKRLWGDSQSDWHLRETGKFKMGCNGDVIQIFLCNFHLPVFIISVQCRKACRLAHGFDTFVHEWYQIQIPDSYCVQLRIVDVKDNRSIPFENKDNR